MVCGRRKKQWLTQAAVAEAKQQSDGFERAHAGCLFNEAGLLGFDAFFSHQVLKFS